MDLKQKGSALVPGTATANEFGDIPSSIPAFVHERIATLAQVYWQTRGCPEGSPYEDWFRAEEDIRTGRDGIIRWLMERELN
jgi:hypothetical protein